MTVASKVVALVATEYTLLTDGMASALLRIRDGQQVRLVIATSLPGVTEVGYFTLFNGPTPFPLAGLATADNVYGRAESGAATVEVIEGPAAS